MSLCLITNPAAILNAFEPHIDSLQKCQSDSYAKEKDCNSQKNKKSSTSDPLDEELDEIKKIPNSKYNLLSKIGIKKAKKNNFELHTHIKLFYQKIPTPPPNQDIV